MSHPNNFQHQQYSTERPRAPYRLLRADGPMPPADDGFAAKMSVIADQLRAANVRNVVLTHGTFAGADGLGVITTLGSLLGKLNAKVKDLVKRVVDALARDAGNFTRGYADTLEDALNQGIPQESPVRIFVKRFNWSSENNHIGRADGAVGLVEFLNELGTGAESPVVVIGHSHGGNVMALATNLINADQTALQRFFNAAESYYRIPATSIIDARHWAQVRDLLMQDGGPRDRLRSMPLRMATLGTPIRYGWDLAADRRLLHIINHKPKPPHPKYLACLPENVNQLVDADVGDLIQLLGIAGTNLIPTFLSPRAIVADRKLNSVLQAGLASKKFLDNFRCGARVAQQGTTFLVDYGPAEGNLIRSLLGHTIYTRMGWMEFHLRTIVQHLFAH